jgi:hypothetical protein
MKFLGKNETEFQLCVYNDRNALAIYSSGIIPKEYFVFDEPENGMGVFVDTAKDTLEPEVLIYFHVPKDKEDEFMSSLSKITDILHPELGGFILVKVVDPHTFEEKVIRLVEPIPAKDLQEHMKWCDLSCWQEYQVQFQNVQAHPTAIKFICPECIKNPRTYHHWYADPDPNNEFTEHVCPNCCTPGVKEDTP